MYGAERKILPLHILPPTHLMTDTRTKVVVTGTYGNFCGASLFLFLAQMYLIVDKLVK